MTRDNIIRMAREAGFHDWYSDPERDYHFGCAERFAALVAAANQRKPMTDEEIRRVKPVCPDFHSFRAGIRFMEREMGIIK
jgi:hypothetical protein